LAVLVLDCSLALRLVLNLMFICRWHQVI
jgi:hypothetical protein